MTDQLDQFLGSICNINSDINVSIFFFGEERGVVRKDAMMFTKDNIRLHWV